MESRWLRTLAVVLSVVVLAAAGRWLRVRSMRHLLATQRYESVYFVPPPQWLRVFSLRHDEALADLLWLRALIYFTDELLHRSEARHLENYAEAMLALDPYFQRVYRWAAAVVLYRPGETNAEDGWRAIDFLERAMRLFPEDGELAWDLGATYSYELAPLLKDPVQKAEVKRKGAEALQIAVLRGAGPPWLALSSARNLHRLGHTEQALRHLQETYAVTRDEQMRERLAQMIIRLKSRAHAEAFQHAQLETERGRERDFSYLDVDMYLLVGKRPPFDGRALRERGFDPIAVPLPPSEWSHVPEQ
ncbi:MAG: hypothetical protein MJD61_04680 [Proteobacteria bacterium]|nr:hypothetical protein [Pseudomonadota bacterium]